MFSLYIAAVDSQIVGDAVEYIIKNSGIDLSINSGKNIFYNISDQTPEFLDRLAKSFSVEIAVAIERINLYFILLRISDAIQEYRLDEKKLAKIVKELKSHYFTFNTEEDRLAIILRYPGIFEVN